MGLIKLAKAMLAMPKWSQKKACAQLL